MQTKKSVKPLLYITQPKLETVVAHMQADFRGNKAIVENVPEKKAEKDTHRAFKNLSIAEKVDYLTSFSSEIPPMRCEIKTNKDVYRGTIQQLSGEEISVHVLGRGKVTVHQGNIKYIRIIGF